MHVYLRDHVHTCWLTWTMTTATTLHLYLALQQMLSVRLRHSLLKLAPAPSIRALTLQIHNLTPQLLIIHVAYNTVVY